MRIAIISPVVLQNEPMLTLTKEAVTHFTTRHQAALYLVCNRLSVRVPEALESELGKLFQGQVNVVHEAGVERSVAGAWNKGCQLALRAGADYIAIIANDTRLQQDCLDNLVEYGQGCEADLWSGISLNDRGDLNPHQVTDGADFTCFMVRPETLAKHGWFDPNYRPAYFEDNDYYGRVVLGGGKCRVVHRARFFHHGSMTVRQDPEMAHHVQYWFEKNRDYFSKKWGVAGPQNSSEGVLSHYYHHPFNDSSKPLSWFPEEGWK
jgi:GT2 family glycosyltransferase